MIVQCEHCSKKFRLNPERITRPTVRVRCSNCQHVFNISRPEKVSSPESIDIMEEARAPMEMRGVQPSGRASSKRLLFLLIPLLVIAGGVALWLYSPSILKPKSSQQSPSIEQLHLVETSGYFVDNLQAGQLFVIQGRVKNEFSKPRRWIHLRAKLYTSDGQTARQLDFYAGNTLSNQQLKNMPLKQLLGLIQRPPANKDQVQTIAAQAEVSFTVPFGDLPELTKLSDYSVEILASQPA